LPPRVAAHVLPVDVRGGVADLVVVLDDVLDFARGTVLASCAGAELEQVRVKNGLFSRRVDLQQDPQAAPDRAQGFGVSAVDVV